MLETLNDLNQASDAELDHALQQGWKRFKEAKAAGNTADLARIHAVNMRILDIQEQRRTRWLDSL